MARVDYDRYELYRNSDSTINQVPFITIPTNPSDKYEIWNAGRSRLDRIAQRYYDNPFYDFLILYANPQYLSEFDIPDQVTIRIPFPIDKVKADYENGLKQIKNS